MCVGSINSMLKHLIGDIDRGLLSSVAGQARAEVFDDFLDHADAYRRDGKKNEGGAIAGVVSEDTIRRAAQGIGVQEAGRNLDSLISELATRQVLTGVKAKRARAAAHVRTKATHAQWEDFELGDVQSTIAFTRELITDLIE